MSRPRRAKEMTIGATYGKWTVLSYSHIKNNRAKTAYWLCKCKCGVIKPVSGSSLRQGINVKCKSCSNKLNGKKGIYRKDIGNDLYMIRCGHFVKIGRSSDVKMRFASLQAANPYKCEIVGVWKNYGHKEEEWHAALKHRKHRGEWYNFSNESTSREGCEVT